MTRRRDLAEAASFGRRRLIATSLLGHTVTEVPDAGRPLRRLAGGLATALLMVGAVAANPALVSDPRHVTGAREAARLSPSRGP